MDNFDELKEKILDVETQLSINCNMNKVLEGVNDQSNRASLIEKDISLVKRDVVHLKENQKKSDRVIEKINDRLGKLEKVGFTTSMTVINIEQRTIEIGKDMKAFIIADKKSIPKADKAIRRMIDIMVVLVILVVGYIGYMTIRMDKKQDMEIEELKKENKITKSKKIPIIPVEKILEDK